MTIAIIDYDAGNTGSIKYALSECGIDCYIAYEPAKIMEASRLILPGVGSFHKAMHVLKERKLDAAIKDAVLLQQKPLLGICLGMQVLATTGYEGGQTPGLNLLPGEVVLLSSQDKKLRLPHVGWNEVNIEKSHDLFQNTDSGCNFYFLHSYHFVSNSPKNVIANTCYGEVFTCAVSSNHVIGVQFHPEKSGKIGRQLLKNFANL